MYGMPKERTQLARLVVKRLMAYHDVEIPVEANQFIREVLELMERQHQAQMQQLQEIRDLLELILYCE